MLKKILLLDIKFCQIHNGIFSWASHASVRPRLSGTRTGEIYDFTS